MGEILTEPSEPTEPTEAAPVADKAKSYQEDLERLAAEHAREHDPGTGLVVTDSS